MAMHVREKRIGGQACYEIVEESEHSSGTKYRVIASLGNEAEPVNALRRHHANLVSLERSLQRIEPLRDADPKIARKCDTLNHRINREKQKLVQLSDAIESLTNPPEKRNQNEDMPGTVKTLKLILNDPEPKAPTETDDWE